MIWCVTLNPALDVTFSIDDSFTMGSVNGAGSMDARLGGKGNNVARVVHRLGQAVTAVEILGGAVGAELRHRAEEQGIPVVFEAVDEDSRICLTFVSVSGQITELRPPGPVVTPSTADRLLGQLERQLGPDDWVTVSGSLPRGLPTDTYSHWVRLLKGRVRGVIVDTSGEALRLAAQSGPAAIVPNRDEFQAIAADLSPGTTDVIVTEGDQGVRWHDPKGGTRYWPAPRVTVRNPVGAGDSFLGGLVTGLAGGLSMVDALPCAIGTASASVETMGVATFDPDRARILRQQVKEATE